MSTITYKCPNCGGDLNFDPDSQKSKCEYCDSTFSQDELIAYATKEVQSASPEASIEEDLGTSSEHAETYLYTCPNCGAEVITDATTSATLCYYCHNPIVLTKQLEGEFRPSKVIPFKLSSQKATDTFLNWCARKWFLPKDFTSTSQLEKLAGLYVPFWLVDCEVSGSLHARGKKISSWVSGDYRYTKTDNFAIYREADMRFEYLPHDASKKMDDAVMESIGPFYYNELEDFSHSFLSGFLAEKYDVNKEEVFPVIEQRVRDAVRSTLRQSIHHYTTVAEKSSNTHFHRTCFHYTLMPVWILTYIYKGETYLFAMNGQTGKLHGRLPIDQKKLVLFTLLVFIISLIICIIGGLYYVNY